MSSTHPHLRITRSSSNQRRSQRVLLSVKVLVSGTRPDGQNFSEESSTSVVNAHGALVALSERVSNGQSLVIRNLSSDEELHAEVIDLVAAQSGKWDVSLEFLEPAPRYWRIAFPPEDWSPRNPEAKRLLTIPQLTPLKPTIAK